MNRALPTNNRISLSRRILMASTALVAAGAMTTAPLNARAENAWVLDQAAGSFETDTSVNNLTNITQHTDRAYGVGDLDIKEYQTVNIHQNNSGSLFVARDNKNDPTQILGALNANGQVMVLDRNGVFFGENSRVDVGGIIASTGDVDIDAIMNGANVMEFGNFGDGSIELKGQISVADAGLAAFVSPVVKNSGVINAKLGRVAFAAGEKVTLDLYGDQLVEIEAGEELEDALLENAGTIAAEGGTVVMTARAAKDAVDNVINMSGVINASSVTQKGGKIILGGGDQGVVKVSGTLNASGTKGGSVEIDGQNTYLTADSKVDVSSTDKENGQAGAAVLWGRDNAIYAGEIDARGEGAFVETSGGNLGVYGDVKMGLGGEWLLDPTNLLIVGVSNLDDSDVDLSGIFAPEDDLGSDDSNDGLGNEDSIFWLYDGLINAALDSGANVTVQTGEEGTNAGNILVRDDAAVLKSAGAESTFTMEAHNNITVDGTIGATGAAVLNVIMTADFDNGAVNSGGSIYINNAVETNGGDFTATAPDAFGIADGGYIDATGSGGNILIDQGGMFSSVNADTLITADTGTITVNQNGGTASGASIQNAIDAIENTGTGTNTINASAGTYEESVEVYEDNFVLNGANAGIHGADDARGAETIVDPNSPGFHVTGNVVTIDGFEITGGDTGVLVDGADYVTLANNAIHDINGDGIHVDDSDNFTAQGNKITNTTSTADDIGSGIQVLNSTHVQIGGLGADEGNVIDDTDWDGIRVENVSDVMIAGNDIDDVKRTGIYGRDTTGLTIEGNDIDNVGHRGINVWRVSNLRILDNHVDTTGMDGIIAREIKSGLLIDGNFVGTDGGAIAEDGIQITSSPGGVVSDNVVNDTTANGIYISGSDAAQVTGNTVTNAAANGIYVEVGSDTVVEANKIEDVGENGIFLNDETEGEEGFDIRDNIITNAAYDGIKVRDFHAGWIAGNMIGFEPGKGELIPTFTGSGDDGIDVKNGEFISIYDNSILGAGFYLDGANASWSGADGIRVKNVGGIDVLPPLPAKGEAEGFGYGIADADTQIFGNTIAFTLDDGIEVENGSRVHIEGNIAGHIGYNEWNADGIRVTNSDHTVIKYNGVADVLDDGIRVDGGFYAGVFGNHVLRVGDEGIEVSNVRYSDAMPVNAPFADIDYPTTGYPVSIEGNEVVLSGDHGIYVHDSGATRIIDNGVLFAGVGQENVYYAVNSVAAMFAGDTPPVMMKALLQEISVSDFGLEWGDGDGIKVENVYRDDYAYLTKTASTLTGSNGDGHYFEYSDAGWTVLIQGNDVSWTGGDGIDVHNAGTTLIGGYEGDANSVYQAGIDFTNILGAESFIDWTENHGPFAEDLDGRRVVWWESDLTDTLEGYLTGGISAVEHDTHDGIRATNIYNDGYYLVRPENPEEESPVVQEPPLGGGAGNAGLDGGLYGYALNIIGNDVHTTGDDGIEAGWSSSALIKDNTVTGAGIGSDYGMDLEVVDEDYRMNYGSGDYNGADGISAHHIYGERGIAAVGAIGENYEEYALVIDGNTVEGAADDGIEALESGRTLISNNHVMNVGLFGNGYHDVNDEIDMYDYFGSHYYDATAGDGYGSDGIHARGIYDHTYSYEDGVYTYGNGIGLQVTQNTVDRTGDDGVEVLGGEYRRPLIGAFTKDGYGAEGLRVMIDHNTITHAGYGGGYYYGAADGWGADGIHVRNVISNGYTEYYDEELSTLVDTNLFNSGTSVTINDNFVDTTADDGIQVLFSGNSLIDHNEVYNAGYGDGGSYGGEGYYDENGADGIHVLTGYLEGYYPKDTFVELEKGIEVNLVEAKIAVEPEPVDYFLSTSTVITNNIVNTADDDGIDVEGVADVLVADNDVDNVNDDGIEVVGYAGGFEPGVAFGVLDVEPFFTATIRNNTVDQAGDNGIAVEDLDEFFIRSNVINHVGLDVNGLDGEVDGNGIQAIFYGNGQITGNIINHAGRDGIFADGYNDEGVGYSLLVSGNDIDDVGAHGVDVNYTDMITITNNDVSNAGEIGILSDYANKNVMFTGNTMSNNPVGAAFNSGVVNMIGASNTFNGGQIGLQFNGPDVALTDNDPLDGFEGSIGTSIFDGQSEFFVELSNDALFQPGQPSLYDGSQSTYLNYTGTLEDMFYHFVDDDTLGLFFLGGIDNLEDFFNTFGTFDGNVSGASVTITGLPSVTPQQTALLLNNLTPAAGVEEGGIPGDTNGDGELSAEELAALDPAAGGEEVGCWSDALSGLEGGATVNYSFDTSFESELNDAASCGVAQAAQ